MIIRKIVVPQDIETIGPFGLFNGYTLGDGAPILGPLDPIDSGDSLAIARRVDLPKGSEQTVPYTVIAISEDSPWQSAVIFVGGRQTERYVVSVGRPFVAQVADDFILVAPDRGFRGKWLSVGGTNADHVIFGCPHKQNIAFTKTGALGPGISLTIYRGGPELLGFNAPMGPRAPYAAQATGDTTSAGRNCYFHAIMDGRHRFDATLEVIVNGSVDWTLVGYNGCHDTDGTPSGSILEETTLASGTITSAGTGVQVSYEFDGAPFQGVYFFMDPTTSISYDWRASIVGYDRI